MRICIFEDTYVTNLSPLNYFRHTSELICGAFTLAEKISNYTRRKYKLSLHCRKYLQNYLIEKFPKTHVNSLENDDYMFLNSRIIYNQPYLKKLLGQSKTNKNFLHTIDNNIIAFHITSDKLSAIKTLIESGAEDGLLSLDKLLTLSLNKLNIANSELKVINYPWDLIRYHEGEINQDLSFEGNKKPAKNLKLSSKVVGLDSSKGKVFISKTATLEPFTYIRGPVYIGENVLLKSGTKIYGPVCIRNNSRVSGEISHSIIHPFVNKQHDGFLGHSYLCEWVNLGAGTTTSNLKNNYSQVSVNLGNGPVNTDSIFLGSMVGDHTKTGISTMLNTGSIIGVSSNLFGSGYMPKFVRSFSWLDADTRNTYVYEIEKALNTARCSMHRRNVTVSKSYEELFNFLFKKTQDSLI